MIEVIDQYGWRHRFDDRHFFDRYDDRVEVMLEENDEVECVATFPHPAMFGNVSESNCLSLREVPPGVARQIEVMRSAAQVQLRNISDLMCEWKTGRISGDDLADKLFSLFSSSTSSVK